MQQVVSLAHGPRMSNWNYEASSAGWNAAQRMHQYPGCSAGAESTRDLGFTRVSKAHRACTTSTQGGAALPAAGSRSLQKRVADSVCLLKKAWCVPTPSPWSTCADRQHFQHCCPLACHALPLQ